MNLASLGVTIAALYALSERAKEAAESMELLNASGWQIPAAGRRYAGLFAEVEQDNGLPKNLLARVAYQESRFRDDIISGETLSAAGAVGIMQIVPKWHPGVDPLNVPEAVRYAGGYLRQLYNQFGSWQRALAAYNWGPGNIRKFGMDRLPDETRNYVAEITADVRVS